MLAGAYTKDLREAYDSGEDIRGAGILNMKAKASQYSMTTLLHQKIVVILKVELGSEDSFKIYHKHMWNNCEM